MSDGTLHTGSQALRVGARLGGIVLAAVVVFGLGVMVGKRVAESVPNVAPPPSALPTETVQPAPAAPAVPAAPAATTTPIPPDKLTFYDRLSGVAQPPPVALPEAQTLPVTPATPTAPTVTAVSAAAPAAAPLKSDAESQIRKLSGKGRFAVQVASLNDRAAADQTAARLKQNGFGVDTVMAVVKGKVWFRIRVGPFPSRDAAAKAAGLFRSSYGMSAIPVQD